MVRACAFQKKWRYPSRPQSNRRAYNWNGRNRCPFTCCATRTGYFWDHRGRYRNNCPTRETDPGEWGWDFNSTEVAFLSSTSLQALSFSFLWQAFSSVHARTDTSGDDPITRDTIIITCFVKQIMIGQQVQLCNFLHYSIAL